MTKLNAATNAASRPADRMWSLRELADAIGVTPDSLRQRIARGTLPAVKLGRDWFVSDAPAQRAIRGLKDWEALPPSAAP